MNELLGAAPPEVQGPENKEKELEAARERARQEVEEIYTQVEAPRVFDLPDVRFEVFDEKTVIMERSVALMKRFLEKPFKYDRFGSDDAARVAWRTERKQAYAAYDPELFLRTYRQIAKDNKFISVSGTEPNMAVELILYGLSEDPTPGEQGLIKEIEAYWDPGYPARLASPTLTVEERVQILKDLEDHSVGLLKIVADYSQRVPMPIDLSEETTDEVSRQAAAK